MTTRTLPKTRFGKWIAYLYDFGGQQTVECFGCHKEETCDKHYYTYYKGGKDIVFWCGDCVRSENPDPRVTWWAAIEGVWK
jgi:hypothetical protein